MSQEEQALVTINNQLTGMEKKIQALFKKKTPKEVIKLRKGAGGKMFPYVPIDYTLKELDATFGIFWEFITDDVRRTDKQIIVRGRLVVKSPNGFSVSRPGVGRANIKMYSGTKDSVDEGNDEKAATSDAIKKAASLFGIAADVYYKELDKYEELDDRIDQTEELKGKAMSRFFAVCSERGIETEKAKARIKQIYKVEHMQELTATQMETTTTKIERTYEPVEPGEQPRKVGELPKAKPDEFYSEPIGLKEQELQNKIDNTNLNNYIEGKKEEHEVVKPDPKVTELVASKIDVNNIDIITNLIDVKKNEVEDGLPKVSMGSISEYWCKGKKHNGNTDVITTLDDPFCSDECRDSIYPPAKAARSFKFGEKNDKTSTITERGISS